MRIGYWLACAALAAVRSVTAGTGAELHAFVTRFLHLLARAGHVRLDAITRHRRAIASTARRYASDVLHASSYEREPIL